MLIPGGKLYKSDHWFDFPPDTTSYYTNIGFLVIGYIIERISGQTIEDYCQEHIFEPLDMKNTSYHPGNLDQENIARPYIRPFILEIPLSNFDHKCFAAMCGVRTSVEDLSHFLIAHMSNGTYKGNRILRNETIELMHTILYSESQSQNVNLHQRSYGMGWFSCTWFGKETEGHGGMNPGGIAYMMTNSSDKTGMIILSNTMDIFEFYKLKFLPRFFAFRQMGKLLLDKADEL
jgi:CubicO group peptidase (beta-lactamase class C family)